MPGLQKIIDGLACLTTHQHPCRDCPWNPHPGMDWVYGCIKGQGDIVEAAQEALREYQEVTESEHKRIDRQGSA